MVLIAAASSLAALSEVAIVKEEPEDKKGPYAVYDDSTEGEEELTISGDAIFYFPAALTANGPVTIEKITLKDGTKKAELRLPVPTPNDNPGYGTYGAFVITWPTKTFNSKGVLNDVGASNRVEFTISKSGTNSAILLDADKEFEVNAGNDLIINAPFRANEAEGVDAGGGAVDITVNKDGKVVLDEWASVYDDPEDPAFLKPSGFVNGASTYTVYQGGELVVRNGWALRGSELTIELLPPDDDNPSPSILTFDIPEGTHDLDGAELKAGGNLNVLRNLVLRGQILPHDDDDDSKVTKTGDGKLTLVSKNALDDSVLSLNVAKGILRLAGSPTWSPGETPSITVASGAELQLGKKSIEQNDDVTFTFVVNGTTRFEDHAIYKGTAEIYPYEPYIAKDNGMRIDTKNITLDVKSGGNAIVDNGVLAVSKITGEGTITINNTASPNIEDKAVLVLTDSVADNYIDFEGTINGTKGNVGLYSTNATDRPFSHQIFRSADVTIDNLIVYGPATLNVSGDTMENDTVGSIWLRGHRPGAVNVDANGQIVYATANAALTVGNLHFMENSRVDFTGLKIDGTGNPVADHMAKITAATNSDILLSDVNIYANKGENKDFPTRYVVPDNGIRAFSVETTYPSRVTFSGDIKGDGVEADFNNKFHQVIIKEDSDVKFTGNGEYFPLAHKNSLYAEGDVKLEITRGATIDGHLTFAGSTNPVPAWDDDFIDGIYPKDYWFNDAGIINDDALQNYSSFTTQIGKRNRVTNEGGEYSVNVTGDITLSKDAFGVYPGNIMVRAKPDLDIFDGYGFTTIGERFKMLGTTEDRNYEDGFATVNNPIFRFRIPSANADPNGVTVEERKELAILTLGSGSFIRGGEEFGLGDGHNFAIKIPFKVIYRGEEITLNTQADGNTTRYYIDLDGVKHTFRLRPYFATYSDGSQWRVSNVLDETALSETLVRDDITLRAEVDVTFGEQYIRLIGTSYTGDNPVDVQLALIATAILGGSRVDFADDVVPGFKIYTFIREGVTPPAQGLQWSTAETEAVDETDFTVGRAATVKFKVDGVRKATYETAAAPVYTENGYVWNDGTITTDYFMPDANSREAKVGTIDAVLFDGDYLSRTTKSSDITGDFTITPDGNGVIVSLSSTLLGNTGTKFDAIKGVSIKGVRSDGYGTIITVPVNFTLHAAMSPDDTIPATTLNNTVVINGDSVSGVYDIPEDVLSRDVHLLGYDLPDWLGFYGNGSTIAYQTGDLTGVEPGTYDFSILAYEGDNALTSNHKLYTFRINVVALHLEVAPTTTMTIPEEGTVKVSVVYGDEDEVRNWTVTAIDDAPKFAAMSGKVTGNGTIELKLATADLAEGTYNYTIAVGTLKAEFAVLVKKPDFEIVEVSNNFDGAIAGRTYTAIFQVKGYEGEIAWSFESEDVTSEIYTVESGDMFIVEGIARRNYDTTEDEDIEQKFILSVTDTVRTGADPFEFGVTVYEEDEDLDPPYAELAPTTGSHDVVAEGYTVEFPSRITVANDEDSLFMPLWLKPMLDRDGENVIGVKYAGPLGDLANGAKATVSILGAEDNDNEYNYQWPVTYAGAAAPEDITVTPAALTVKVGETVTATASVALVSSDTEWVKVNGTTVTAAPTDAALAGAPIVVTLTAADGRTTKLTVTVTQRDVFSISVGNAEFTLPDTGTLTAKSTGAATGGTVTYTATVDKTGLTVGTFTGDTATLTATAAGTYTVTVNATDAAGATASDTATVIVNPAPTPNPFSISANPTSVTVDAASTTTVTLTPANAQGTVSYTASETWVTFSGNVATFAPTAAGDYTVTITATDGSGNKDEVEISVKVNEVVATFSVTADPLTFTMTVGQETTANLETKNASGAVSYSASVDWVTINSETAVATIKPTAEGEYTVTITATDAEGQTATTRLSVTVANVNNGSVGSSGGGCDAGFGALALVLAAPLFLRKRRS